MDFHWNALGKPVPFKISLPICNMGIIIILRLQDCSKDNKTIHAEHLCTPRTHYTNIRKGDYCTAFLLLPHSWLLFSFLLPALLFFKLNYLFKILILNTVAIL